MGCSTSLEAVGKHDDGPHGDAEDAASARPPPSTVEVVPATASPIQPLPMTPREQNPFASNQHAEAPLSPSASTIDSDQDLDRDQEEVESVVGSQGSAEVIVVPPPDRLALQAVACFSANSSPMGRSLVAPLTPRVGDESEPQTKRASPPTEEIVPQERRENAQTEAMGLVPEGDAPLPFGRSSPKRRPRPESASAASARSRHTAKTKPHARFNSPERELVHLNRETIGGTRSSAHADAPVRDGKPTTKLTDTMARFLRFRSKTPPR